MIDSTNPRILADNIRSLTDKTEGLSDAQIAQAAELVALGAYSTDEIDTGKKWLDNSIIYRKVIFVETLPNAGSTEIVITGLKDIISIGGFMPETTGFAGRPVPYSNVVLFRYNAGRLYVVTSSDYSSYSAYIIVEYTKSAASSSDLAPAPDDTRSIEPEVREEDPEAEPVIDEPIEEPVKKTTTRKKTTTTE